MYHESIQKYILSQRAKPNRIKKLTFSMSVTPTHYICFYKIAAKEFFTLKYISQRYNQSKIKLFNIIPCFITALIIYRNHNLNLVYDTNTFHSRLIITQHHKIIFKYHKSTIPYKLIKLYSPHSDSNLELSNKL